MENFTRASLKPLTYLYTPPLICRWEMGYWIRKTMDDLKKSFNSLTKSDDFKNLHILEKSYIFKMYNEAKEILTFFEKSYIF